MMYRDTPDLLVSTRDGRLHLALDSRAAGVQVGLDLTLAQAEHLLAVLSEQVEELRAEQKEASDAK